MFYLHPYKRIAWVMGNETVFCGGLDINIRGSKHEFGKKIDIELRIWL